MKAHFRHVPETGGGFIALRLMMLILALSYARPASTSGIPEKSLPNLVIILTDDQGYADVGVFGARGFQTPNLDRLAAQGCIFRNFHVAQPVCSASRAALLTGCYPNRIGIHGALGPGSKIGIGQGESTLADLLKQRGYATAIFGKWHLGDQAVPAFASWVRRVFRSSLFQRHVAASPGFRKSSAQRPTPEPWLSGTEIVSGRHRRHPAGHARRSKPAYDLVH